MRIGKVKLLLNIITLLLGIHLLYSVAFDVIIYCTYFDGDKVVNEKVFVYNYTKLKMNKDVKFQKSLKVEDLKSFYNHTSSVILKTCKPNAIVINVVNSFASHFNLRMEIRSLHGNHTHKYRYKLPRCPNNDCFSHCTVFAVGLVEDTEVHQLVEKEMEEKGDIILVPLLDYYRLMANKLILVYDGIDHCSHKFKYILKSDDDVYINFEKLLFTVVDMKGVSFGGMVYSNLLVRRDPDDIWYLSHEEHPEPIIKRVIIGVANIINREIIPELVLKHNSSILISMEDVHISYLVEKCGHNLTDLAEFQYSPFSYLLYPKTCIIHIGRSKQFRKYRLDKIMRTIYEN